MSGGGRRWTKEELQALLNGIGAYGIKWFQKRTQPPNDWPNAPKHRSVDAIYAAARRHFGPGGLTRGSYSLHHVMQVTGYSRTQVLRARDALGQKWKRLGPGGNYLISEEQLGEVCDWLRHDYWDKDKHLYCCLGCQTEKRRPFGLGLCGRCYSRYRRLCLRLNLPTSQEGQAEVLRKVLEGDKAEEHDRVLDEIASQLQQGRALSARHLEWLHLMNPDGA